MFSLAPMAPVSRLTLSPMEGRVLGRTMNL
jgi:hypothetical protein